MKNRDLFKTISKKCELSIYIDLYNRIFYIYRIARSLCDVLKLLRL